MDNQSEIFAAKLFTLLVFAVHDTKTVPSNLQVTTNQSNSETVPSTTIGLLQTRNT